MKNRWFNRLFALSIILMLVILMLYIVGYLAQAPYPGFLIAKDGKTVIKVFDANQTGKLLPGDQLIEVNEILSNDYHTSLTLQYWKGVDPGDSVPISFLRNGVQKQVNWIFTGQTKSEFRNRFLSPIWFSLILWALGVAAFLTIRPTDGNWRLFIAFCMLLAIGFVTFYGPSDHHLWYRAYLVRLSGWISVPLLIDFPWRFPDRILDRRTIPQIIANGFWTSVTAAGFYVDLLQPGLTLYKYAIFCAMIIGIVLLCFRYVRQRGAYTKVKLILMVSITAYLLGGVAMFLEISEAYVPAIIEGILLVGIILCPFSVIYSVWAGKLNSYQFRASRYLPMALYSILVIMVLTMLLMIIENNFQQIEVNASVLIAVGVSMITIQTYPLFQRLVDTHIFRIPVSSKDLLQSFSKQLDRTKDTKSISSLMGNLILPALLVRQSALIEFQRPNRTKVIDLNGILQDQVPSVEQIHALIDLEFRVVPPQTMHALFPRELHWIRVVVPLIFDDQLIGVWLLGQRDPNDLYDDYIVDLLQAIAQQTTIALINHRKSQRLVTLYKASIDREEEDRARLARNLHDDTLNDLALLQREIKDPRLSEGITRVINSLRETISGLRPEMLSYGLVTALTDLGDALNERQDNTRVLVELEGSPDSISPNIEQHLYRIVQQACENALRHSGADLIRIQGIISEWAIQLSVVDNGIGFDTNTMLDFSELIANQHYGLAGMQERASLLNAELDIHSTENLGTRISIYWSKSPH